MEITYIEFDLHGYFWDYFADFKREVDCDYLPHYI